MSHESAQLVCLASYRHCAYTGVVAEASKETRWNLRVAAETSALVRQAASARHQNLTEFVLDAALDEAERVLADRSHFALDEENWNEFARLLERPVRDNPGLARLFAKPSVFA